MISNGRLHDYVPSGSYMYVYPIATTTLLVSLHDIVEI